MSCKERFDEEVHSSIIMRRFKVLYSTRLTQRDKKWQDGFIDVLENGWIKLVDSDRSVLQNLHFNGDILFDGTPFKFENYLVQIDSDQEIQMPQNDNNFKANQINSLKNTIRKPFQSPKQRVSQKIEPLTLVPSPPRNITTIIPENVFEKRINPRTYEEILKFLEISERNVKTELANLPF